MCCHQTCLLVRELNLGATTYMARYNVWIKKSQRKESGYVWQRRPCWNEVGTIFCSRSLLSGHLTVRGKDYCIGPFSTFCLSSWDLSVWSIFLFLSQLISFDISSRTVLPGKNSFSCFVATAVPRDFKFILLMLKGHFSRYRTPCLFLSFNTSNNLFHLPTKWFLIYVVNLIKNNFN